MRTFDQKRSSPTPPGTSGGDYGRRLRPPVFAVQASLTQPPVQREEESTHTVAGYPQGYEMSNDQFLAEHQRDMVVLYQALATSELLTTARRLQAALDASAPHDGPTTYLAFEQARSLFYLKELIEQRVSNYFLSQERASIFGGEDDIDTALGDVNDPLWGIMLPAPFDRHGEWNAILTAGGSFRQPEDPAATAAANPRLSRRVRRGNSGPAAEAYRLAPYIAQLFSRGPGDRHAIDPNDVAQGQLSNCYFMAAIAAVAQTHPEALGRLIRENGDGTFDVTLYVSGDRLNPSQSRTVTVRPDIPVTAQGGQAYAQITSANEPELWVQLLEKAYATIRGGYGALDTGGDAGTGLFALTGERGTYYPSRRHNEAAIRTLIQEALDENWPIIAGTPSGNSQLRTAYGITNWHMYYITGFNLHDELELGNPWGRDNLTGDEAVPINVFRQTFHGFTILRDYEGGATSP